MIRALAFPKAELKLTRKSGRLYVWCAVRKKTLVLTPEEWVRQHVIHYLINHKAVPPGLIAAEVGVKIKDLQRRCDILVYNRSMRPVMVIECKAPEIGLDERVVTQIAHYNYALGVDYLMITNGVHHILSRIDHGSDQLIPIEDIPSDLCDH